jgi:hypothetical protein
MAKMRANLDNMMSGVNSDGIEAKSAAAIEAEYSID